MLRNVTVEKQQNKYHVIVHKWKIKCIKRILILKWRFKWVVREEMCLYLLLISNEIIKYSKMQPFSNFFSIVMILKNIYHPLHNNTMLIYIRYFMLFLCYWYDSVCCYAVRCGFIPLNLQGIDMEIEVPARASLHEVLAFSFPSFLVCTLIFSKLLFKLALFYLLWCVGGAVLLYYGLMMLDDAIGCWWKTRKHKSNPLYVAATSSLHFTPHYNVWEEPSREMKWREMNNVPLGGWYVRCLWYFLLNAFWKCLPMSFR